MDLQAEKIEFAKLVLDITDFSLLKELETVYNRFQADPLDNLTDDQMVALDKSIAQADKGQTVSHKDAMKRLGL